MLPTFVLIGTMRGGTTSLMRYLGAHPDVHVAPQKEVHFFDRHFDRGVGWYEGQFAGRSTERAVGEGTPAYLYSDLTMDRLKTTLPAAQLIVSLRNPVDRAYSHYWNRRARGHEHEPFVDAVKRDRGPGPDGGIRNYLAMGRYVQFLRRLEPDRDAGRLHVVLFEDLRDEPRPTFSGVCRFLGVDGDIVPDVVGGQLNPSVEYRSVHVRRWTKRLPPRLRNAVGKVNTKEAVHPPLSPDVRAQVRKQFDDDNAALAAWLGRDLSVWNS